MLGGMVGNFWLVKQEPEDYPWDQFTRDGRTAWTGVRNYQARNFLRDMRLGDLVFFYHSVSEKRVAGVAKVIREAYPDPTAEAGEENGAWRCVDLAPVKPLTEPVSLEIMKQDALLREIHLVKQSRLSVMPIGRSAARRILELGKTVL